MRMSGSLIVAMLVSPAAFAQSAPRADLCAELSAFITAQVGDKLADTAPNRQQATAVQAPGKDDQRPQPGGRDAPQQTSGMSGPVTHEGTGAPGPQGVQQPAPQPAPAAASAPVAPSPKPDDLEAAHKAVDAKDALACREATQKMRRAGVAVPAPLLALGALDPKILSQQK